MFYDGTVENITERKRTEKTLAKSEEKYRGIFENIQDVFYEISLDGTILEVSPSIEIISKGGYHRDDLLGKSIYDFYSIKGGRRALLALLNERGSVTDYEVILKNPDGSHVPCSISAKIQFDSDSNPLKIIGSMRDITERKKAEEEIRESEERFRMVFENVFDGISIYSEDPDPSKRRLIECNIRYASMAGRSRDELLKLGNTAGLQITLQDRANDNRMESMERGTAYQGSFSWIRPDEKENVAEYIAIPVTWRGKIHSIGIDRDITERKRAERELRKLSRAVEQSPASIIITDLKGDIEYVNPKALELTGYRLDELIGKNPRIWSSGQTTAGEYEFHNKKKNGILYWELASISAIINEKKEITNYLAVKEDITERKRLEQELIISKEKAEEMSRLKSSFLANMSHELRTPLIGINGFADFLRQDITDPELKEMAENIFTSGNRLSETLNHILDLSKLESDKMDFNCQEIDLVNETKNVLSLFKETARKKGLYLKISFSQASIIINTDMLSIRSILVNIINNAIKFTNEGSVAVDISLKDDFVEIKVIDSGIGVSKEYHRIIFEEFRQVSEGFSRNFEGTGLGLSITKKLIEKLGGEISVDSELGKGSVFIVKLPVTRAEEKIVIEKVEKNVLPQVKSVKPVALLVDDDPFAHSILKRYIDGQADLDSIADGEFAVQLCMKKQYDYIFMDINLGSGMDGKQVTQTIRKIKGYESIPIIATTAYVMVGDKEEFLAAGCSHYISKPFTQEIIFNLLKEILIDK